MENENRMVAVKSMVNARVSVKDPTYGVNRRWDRKGQQITLPYSVVEGMLWQDGFRHLIEGGILYIDSLKDKQDLGLEPEDVKEPVNIIVLTEIQMKNLLTTTPFIVFKKELQMLTRTQIDNLIEYAIKNQLIDIQKCSFLKKLTGRDIISAIKANEEDAEAEERERRQQAMRNRDREEGRRI